MEKEILAIEGFIRRAAENLQPFMLKGSFVTRQYFANPADRLPNDLDWLYLGYLREPGEARTVFDEWATLVTETPGDDGVRFRSFGYDPFWRMIDYAMSDDFPTVNTDIVCWVDEERADFSLDISFNLEIGVPPVDLIYEPVAGEPFIIPYTVPLPLQISWKLHQTLVRPRFKDLFDLIHLLRHPSFDEKMLRQSIKALVDECAADKVNIKRLEWLIKGDLEEIYKPHTAKWEWHYWRTGEMHGNPMSYETAKMITDPAKLPQNLHTFAEELSKALNQAGFVIDVLDHLPAPAKHKTQGRKGVFGFFTDWSS